MNNTHRIVGVLALAFLLVGGPVRASWPGTGPAGTNDGPGDPQLTEKFSKTVPLAKGGAVDLANISGDIVVTGGAGDQVVIDAIKRGRTAEDLKALQIEVNAAPARVEIRAQYPREQRNINASVDFTVTVPRGANVTLRSVSGDIKLSTVDGVVSAETVSGNVGVTSAAQLESAKTVSGDVTVESAASDGDLSVASVSGNVKLKAVKARGIETNSVSGDVDMADVSCNRARAKSVSGDIVFGGALAKGGRYVFQSHSGDVTFYADESTGFEVAAGTFSGEISSDLKLVSTFGGEGEGGQPGHRPKRGGPGQRVQGTFGDGSAFLELGSFSGNVKIVKKGAAAKPVKK